MAVGRVCTGDRKHAGAAPVDPWELRRAASVVRSGGVIAYPTEAVFGLGCDPLNQDAVMRVLRLKRRRMAKGLIVIAASVDQLSGLVMFPSPEVYERCVATWPGPVTWVLPARARIPRWLTGGRECLAVRVTAHPLAGALCRRAGPLVSTSANPGACVPARTACRVRAYFKTDIDYILGGQVLIEGLGTEIREALSDRVLRPAARSEPAAPGGHYPAAC